MKVHFLTRSGPHLASYRLRTLFAAQAVGATIGPYWQEADVHVFSKHWDYGELELASTSPCAIFDVCDDHFTSTPAAIAAYPWIRKYYRKMCGVAKVVTCGSEALARIIKEKTGRDAVVIEEPWETEEQEPRFDPRVDYESWRPTSLNLLWFGHGANLKHLNPILDRITDPLEIVTNGAGTAEWSPETQAHYLSACHLVILPQKDTWKSANRAVTALRAGRYAVADPVPSYEGICWTGGVLEGIEWVKQNPGSIIEKIRLGQRHIRERFNPEKLRKQWSDCILGAVENTSPASST